MLSSTCSHSCPALFILLQASACLEATQGTEGGNKGILFKARSLHNAMLLFLRANVSERGMILPADSPQQRLKNTQLSALGVVGLFSHSALFLTICRHVLQTNRPWRRAKNKTKPKLLPQSNPSFSLYLFPRPTPIRAFRTKQPLDWEYLSLPPWEAWTEQQGDSGEGTGGLGGVGCG